MKEKRTLKKHISGNGISYTNLKNSLYFRDENEKFEKQKSLLKVVSYDAFSTFTTVKYREIPCKPNVMLYNRNKLLEHFKATFGILNEIFV